MSKHKQFFRIKLIEAGFILGWWCSYSLLTTITSCCLILFFTILVICITTDTFNVKERKRLHCSPTPIPALLRYASAAGSSACFGSSFPSLSFSPFSPNMHILRDACVSLRPAFPKGGLRCAQQRVGDLLPSSLFKMLLVQPELGLSLCVCYRSLGVVLKQLLKRPWITPSTTPLRGQRA